MRFIVCHHSKCIAALVALVMLASVSVFAETLGSSTLKNKTKKDSEALKIAIDIELKAITYAEASNVDKNSQQQFQAGLDLKKQGTFFTEASLIIGTFSEPGSVYYAFPQGFVGYGSQDANLAFGRKKENLSVADSLFSFGLLQSGFSNDNINFLEGGLTGLHGHYFAGKFGLSAAFMPIFIPNQGPQTKIEDGKVVSTNRWASAPPATFKEGKEQKNINYAIRDYNLLDIISNSGFMLHGYYGGNKTRPLISVAIAKKPVNEIALSRDMYQDISTAEGFVYLTPVVLNHEVQALDFNLDYENINTSLSYLADQPTNVVAKSPEVIQSLSPLNIVSFFASLDLGEVFKRKMKVYTALAVISGGEVRDLNSEGKESGVSIANSRTLYKKPLRFGLNGEAFFVGNGAIETDLAMTYDQELKGSLLSVVMKYAAMKNLKVNLGADIIGTESELQPSAPGNFLDQHKADDRFFAGLSYAF